MSSRSPKERLHRLFHRHDAGVTKDDAPSTPPQTSPKSPSSSGDQRQARRTSSRTSLSDMVHGKSRSDPSKRSRKSVGNAAEIAPSPGGQAAAQAAAQVAAAKAQYQGRDTRLPSLPRQTALSSDFGNLTLSDENAEAAVGRRPYSEDVADRNIDNRGLDSYEDTMRSRDRPFRSSLDPRPESGSGTGNATPVIANRDRYSEGVADWNIVQNDQPLAGGKQDLPQPLNVKKKSSVDLRRSQDAVRSSNATAPLRNSRRSLEAGGAPVGRSSLDKQLPPAPVKEGERGPAAQEAVKHDSGVESELGRERGYLVKDSDKPIDLAGIVDLRNTMDTTLHERWAPAVTHETIIKKVHEIREEQITREIHNHHYHHRILPVVDIEVLPSRHFVPVEDGYVEISEDEVPGRAGSNADWVIAETVSQMMPKSEDRPLARNFTARQFKGTEGDYKEYMTPEGFKRDETWWVHPPEIETGGRETGQTYPFYFGSPNPEENGLRASLPGGKLLGVSPLLAKQRREREGAQPPSASHVQADGVPPPVPPHKSFPAELVDSARAGH